jgi:hypothetical protein
MLMRPLLCVSILGVLTVPAWAVPAVDGTLDAEYGSAIVAQLVDTNFGDANPPGTLGGSELDAAYARVRNGRLYLMLTGNHEPNFNKLDIFIDSKVGGENTLTNTPEYDFDPPPPGPGGGNWISKNLSGLTFDAVFSADYHLFSRWGSGTGPYEVDFVDRAGGGSAMVPGASAAGSNAVGLVSTGSIPAGDVGPNASGSSLTQALQFAINHNNNAGVAGGTGPANILAALAVTTGMEFSIPLRDLDVGAGGVIRVAAMINNGDHNYLSNQVLGALIPPKGNLGGDGNGGFTGTLSGINFNELTNLDPAVAGNQYFTVTVPEPSTMVLVSLALAGLAGAMRRRK